MKKRVLGIMLGAVMAVGLLAGCGSSSSSSTAESTAKTEESTAAEESKATEESTEESTVADAGKSYKIGFSQCTLASPFYTTMQTAAEDYAKELGVELVFVSADDDVQKQNNDVLDMISSGIDALIINPMNSSGVATALQAAADAGIPIVTIDRYTDDSNVTARVVRDNSYMGQIVGEELLASLKADGINEGTIIELQGTAGDSVMEARRDGFEGVFEGTNYTIVQSVNCDYTRSLAITAAQDLIQAHQDDIVAIYGHNDDMAIGGLQAVTEAGLSGVKVCGVDGLMEAVQSIANGEGYVATSMNDPTTLLYTALDTCVDLLNGEKVEAEVDAGTGLINADNASDYVSDAAFALNE